MIKDDPYCVSCGYYLPISSTYPGRKSCHYMDITGHARIKICPPGKDCTVRKVREING